MQTILRDKAGTVVFGKRGGTFPWHTIHRCTIYDYITHTERPLPFFRMQDNLRIQFRGEDLIAYKTAGLPKKGRKRK